MLRSDDLIVASGAPSLAFTTSLAPSAIQK
jgi:hypothetical protein